MGIPETGYPFFRDLAYIPSTEMSRRNVEEYVEKGIQYPVSFQGYF